MGRITFDSVALQFGPVGVGDAKVPATAARGGRAINHPFCFSPSTLQDLLCVGSVLVVAPLIPLGSDGRLALVPPSPTGAALAVMRTRAGCRIRAPLWCGV